MIGAHSEETMMIGDRMDTDVVAGMEAGLGTMLVLTGVTTRETAARFPYRPPTSSSRAADLIDSVDSDQFLRTASDR